MYDSLVSKQSKAKITDPKLEEDLSVAKEIYKSMNMELVLKLNEFQKKKDYFLEAKAVDYFYVGRNFFHSVNTIFNSNEKEVNMVSQEVKVSRTSLDDEVKEQRIKKNLLEKYKENAHKHVQELTSKRKESLFVNNDVNLEGYLFKKSSNVLLNWSKCYCVLQGGVLSYYKNDKFKESKKLNLLLCSVKISPQDDRRFCFELFSPQKSVLFQAETQEELEKWVNTIKNIIAEQLNKNKSVSEQKEGSSLGRNERILENLIKSDETNAICCDCKSENPKWASLNLGNLFCIECSGVHRSLGVQYSKVRSFELDDWENESVNVFKRLGNQNVNKVYESNKEELEKNTPLEWNRITRESFIKSKYIDKKFIDFGDSKFTENELNEQLILATKEKNMERAFKLIAFGANPSYKDTSNDELTPLHYAVIEGDLGLCEFLLQQYGVNPNVCDVNLWTPLHYASKLGSASITSLLFKRRADLDLKTVEGFQAIDLATQTKAADCLTLLRLAQLALNESSSSKSKQSFSQTLTFFSSLIKEMGGEEQF